MKLTDLQEAKYAKRADIQEYMFNGYSYFFDSREVQQAFEKVDVAFTDVSKSKPYVTFVTVRATAEQAEHLNYVLGQIHFKINKSIFYGGYQSTEDDLQEARYAAPKRTGRELAILIRRGILDTFPQWKPLRRLKVMVGISGDVANRIYVSLMTGLLDAETKDAFNETGALHDNAQRIGKVIEDATGRIIKDHFSHFDHRERAEEISYNLEPMR